MGRPIRDNMVCLLRHFMAHRHPAHAGTHHLLIDAQTVEVDFGTETFPVSRHIRQWGCFGSKTSAEMSAQI
jgi:hypothetical protein